MGRFLPSLNKYTCFFPDVFPYPPSSDFLLGQMQWRELWNKPANWGALALCSHGLHFSFPHPFHSPFLLSHPSPLYTLQSLTSATMNCPLQETHFILPLYGVAMQMRGAPRVITVSQSHAGVKVTHFSAGWLFRCSFSGLPPTPKLFSS